MKRLLFSSLAYFTLTLGLISQNVISDEGGFPLEDIYLSKAEFNNSITSELLIDSENIVPIGYTDMLGEGSNAWPFAPSSSFGTTLRYQQLILGTEIDLSTINQVCFRRDEFDWGVTGGIVDATIKIGSTDKTLTTMSPTFDDNYSGSPTTVFDGSINFPDMVGTGDINSFTVCIDFDTPYTFDGNNFIIEVQTNASDLLNKTYFMDFCTPCNTSRIFAFDVNATTAFDFDGANQGLIMKFIEDSIPIPTLSQWGIITLSMIMLVFGVVAVRQRKVLFAS